MKVMAYSLIATAFFATLVIQWTAS